MFIFRLFKSVNFIKLRSKGFCYNWVLLNMLLFLEIDGTHNFSIKLQETECNGEMFYISTLISFVLWQ